MQGHSRSGMKAGEVGPMRTLSDMSVRANIVSAFQGSDLGGFLAQALVTNGADSPVMFIGTDCVTIPTAILLEAQGAAASGTAYLCPATGTHHPAAKLQCLLCQTELYLSFLHAAASLPCGKSKATVHHCSPCFRTFAPPWREERRCRAGGAESTKEHEEVVVGDV